MALQPNTVGKTKVKQYFSKHRRSYKVPEKPANTKTLLAEGDLN